MSEKNVGKREKIFNSGNFLSYTMAGAYGIAETLRAMRFSGDIVRTGQPVPIRATEGFAGMLDQNTGDGTIMALGFLGSEVVLHTMDLACQKLWNKQIDPELRFVVSVAFGIGLATHLETTTAMSNTIDVPGDLFGIGLAAALILGSKSMGKVFNERNFNSAIKLFSTLRKTIPEKMEEFNRKLFGMSSSAPNLVKELDQVDTANVFVELVSGEYADQVAEER